MSNYIKRKHIILSIFALFFWGVAPTLNAQQLETKTNDSSSTWQILKYDANTSWKSIKHAVSRPFHWKGKDFAKLGGIVAGTLAISATDQATSDFFRRQDDSFPQPIQEFGFYFAAPQNYLMANAGLYGVGLFTNNEQIRRTSVLIISSSITAGYLQIFARTAIGRARPFSGDSPSTFKPFAGEEDYLSFPSGHTVLGITMAHSIAKQFENPFVKIGIYSIGSIPAFTRLVDGAHWLSDVAFGAALSIVVVDSIDKFLFKSESYKSKLSKPKKVSWNISFGGNSIGLRGTF